jgi:phage gp29-like protein
MAANPDVVDTTKPEALVPDTATMPVTEPLIQVEVQDRLLRELKRRLFPNDVEGILYSAIVGDLYWQDQLWSLMVDTWPRLQTNLGKLKQSVSSMEFAVTPYADADDEPTPSALEKADFVKTALFGMHGDVAFQQHDFKETLEDIVDSIVAGFTVMEVYWEQRDGGIMPQCTRWLPARYYRYPYVLDDVDRLMLNPSGMLGGTQLVDFPPYKFLVCIKQSHANHPVFTAPMRTLSAWWIASRFGLEWFMTYAQLFGIPNRIAYYQPGDDVVYQKLVQMMRQSAAATWGVYPKGTEVNVTSAAGGSSGHLPQERLLDEADKVCDIMLLGQTLTTEVRESGGNRALGTVHRKVMDEVMEAAAKYAAKIITTQIIPGIIIYNFGEATELPTLAPVVNSPIDLFNLAQAYNILFNQMKIPVLNKELYARIEFTPPEDDDDVYQPPAAPTPPPSIFGQPHPQPAGTRPEPAGAPNGSKEPGAKPNIVERVGAAGLGDADCCDPLFDGDGEGADGIAVPARKVSFALDYGEEPEPGEVMRFVEARHEHRHPETGRFIPALIGLEPETETPKPETEKAKPETKAPKRKVGIKRAEPMPEVGLMLKHSQTMEDNKVCQACKDICEEGWIPVDEEYLGYSMNPPHHPNCRCSNEYKTQYRGVDILHQTKSGNPHHHPETGRFVAKPKRS